MFGAAHGLGPATEMKSAARAWQEGFTNCSSDGHPAPAMHQFVRLTAEA